MDVKGKNVFISGPMTGKPDWNREAFAEAERELYELGAKLVFNPAADAPKGEDDKGHDYWMRRTVRELSASRNERTPRYDLLVQLPGCFFSKGAKLEKKVAEACGIEVIPYALVGEDD